MSSFLKDKEWENMDWLNRAVEPFTFSFNAQLAKIPTEFVLNYNFIVTIIQNDRDIRLSSIVRDIVRDRCGKDAVEMLENIGVDKLFEFKLEQDTTIDLEREIIVGSLSVRKKMESLNDDVIRELLPQLVYSKLRINSSRVEASLINEVMDILECKEARSSSSLRKKAAALQQHVYEIYKENKWNLRNVDLAIKMLGWIASYCMNGDRHSLANMSKLKCMIHNGHPIYSMEEIV
jgi:hypothetical protein